jgi:hypothetical protein
VKGVASIRLALTDIMQGSRTVAITTDTFAATAESSTTRDAEIIGGGAVVGAVIGAIAGGKKGAGIGAISGKGEELVSSSRPRVKRSASLPRRV